MSHRPRVLVCDHEPLSALALRRVLRDAGFDVDVTSTAADGLDHATRHMPDAIIVELGLPDGDGADVCRRVREWSEMPLIVLSAVDAEDEKVRALEAGADHYIVKPFAPPRELVARLAAVLRRAGPHDTAPRFAVDGLQIDLAARVLRRENEEIHLTPIEFKLLHVLLRHRGRPLYAPCLARADLGPGTRRGHADAADAHRQPAPEDRARGGASSEPSTASATASPTRAQHPG